MADMYVPQDMFGFGRLANIEMEKRREDRLDKESELRNQVAELQLAQTVSNLETAKRKEKLRDEISILVKQPPEGENSFTAAYKHMMANGAFEEADSWMKRQSDIVDDIWKRDRFEGAKIWNATIGKSMGGMTITPHPERKDLIQSQKPDGTPVWMTFDGNDFKVITPPEGVELTSKKPGKDEDKWVDWGYGQKKNLKTGKIEKVPVPPRGSSEHPIERTPTKRESELAKALAEGKMDVSQLPKRGDSFNMIVSLAMSMNPNLNLRESTANFALAKNPTFRQKAIVAESVKDIMDSVVEAGKKVDFSNLKAYGTFQKFVKEQTNDPQLVEYMALRNDALMELAFVMRGAGMTDQAHRAESEAASPTMSPRALDAWMKAQTKALEPRLKRYGRVIENKQTNIIGNDKRAETKKPTRQEFIDAASKDPRNKGVSPNDLGAYYDKKYGGM